jgi:hypothetical protein
LGKYGSVPEGVTRSLNSGKCRKNASAGGYV